MQTSVGVWLFSRIRQWRSRSVLKNSLAILKRAMPVLKYPTETTRHERACLYAYFTNEITQQILMQL